MEKTINNQLKEWAEQYETADFIKNDPIEIPHRYKSKADIEISAFITSWITWGSRIEIIKMANIIDREIFKGNPWHYICGDDWKQHKGKIETFYRTLNTGIFTTFAND